RQHEGGAGGDVEGVLGRGVPGRGAGFETGAVNGDEAELLGDEVAGDRGDQEDHQDSEEDGEDDAHHARTASESQRGPVGAWPGGGGSSESEEQRLWTLLLLRDGSIASLFDGEPGIGEDEC